ncbi:MAG: cell wall metabolism sensor histidine kinase WalK [Tissierellia bacterium]|nr:cell wall metabolism sensor histidine kinase WalK [Tissierellia bacterium]
MFKSIRWRFILIYFLLVFLAMSIVGIYIVNQLEKIQIDMNIKNMEARIRSIIDSYSTLKSGNWDENIEEIQESISTVQVGYNENIYVILNDNNRTIIAGSVEESIGISAFNYNKIDNYILTKSLDGTSHHTAPAEQFEDTENQRFYYHMSFPVQADGSIRGYIYLINNIDYIYDTVDESKQIMTQATIIALTITIFLGLILSTSITGPIKELTLKARQMSMGDFEQKVNVKSDDEIGQLGNMFNYLIDQLKRSMSSLQQEKSKMETTLTYMADGVLTVDLSGNIIHANPVAKNILSIKSTDEKFNDVIVNLKDSITIDYIKSKDYHGTDLVEKDEETYNIDYAPFMNNKNEIGGVILVFKNITEQHRIDKLQKEFVANVSHELKTPITTIKSYAETLLDGALEEQEIAEEFLNVINSESDRMSRLVTDLLRLSKMDYEQTVWHKERINLQDMVNIVVKKLQMQIKEKNIDMHINVPNDINIMFDRDGFEQILLNIAGNAVKYTPEKGKVWIDAKKIKKNVLVSIKDDGYGIPKEDQDRIFERFYRVEKARARGMGGTGLGLSIAKQIAEAHNCTITVKSQINEGTEMIITIPE